VTDPCREELDLVRRLLAGDEVAVEAFSSGYFPGLLRFALKRLPGEAELARDLVQTTVCKALGKLAGYRGEAPLATWLCACFRNELLMHFRQKGRQPPLVEIDEPVDDGPARELVAPGDAPEAALLRREEARRVHSTLDRLPPHYAHALEWKYVEQVSVEEISRRLGVGEKAAESLLGRARRAFREGYEGARGRWPRPVEVRT
jgi:RNA polymerase sigma-70 factor (ECF subfamily)